MAHRRPTCGQARGVRMTHGGTGLREESRSRVLVVEDDVRFADLVGSYLETQGLAVSVHTSGAGVPERVASDAPDLLILDVMLPQHDGFEVCRRLRRTWSGPILILTARSETIDHIVGLEVGADDFVTKPVEPRVLFLRVQALLRRCGRSSAALDRRLVFGDLVIDGARREVLLAGRPVSFTTSEFDLLWMLATNAGRALSRDELCASLRGIGYDGLDRSIDMRICKLRQKVGDEARRPQLIKTVHGVGYLFAAPP